MSKSPMQMTAKEGGAMGAGFIAIALVYLVSSSTFLPTFSYMKHELKFRHQALLITCFFLFQAICLPVGLAIKFVSWGWARCKGTKRDAAQKSGEHTGDRSYDSTDEEDQHVGPEQNDCAKEKSQSRRGAIHRREEMKSSGDLGEDDPGFADLEDPSTATGVGKGEEDALVIAKTQERYQARLALGFGNASYGNTVDDEEAERQQLLRDEEKIPDAKVEAEYPVKATAYLIVVGIMEVVNKVCQAYATDHLGSSYVMLLAATKLIFVALQRAAMLKEPWPLKIQLLGMGIVLIGCAMSETSVILDNHFFPEDQPQLQDPHRAVAGQVNIRPVTQRVRNSGNEVGASAGENTNHLQQQPPAAQNDPNPVPARRVKSFGIGIALALAAPLASSFGFVFQELAGRVSPTYSSFLGTGVQGMTSFALAVGVYAVLILKKKQPSFPSALEDIGQSTMMQVLLVVFFVLVLTGAVTGLVVSRKNATIRVLLENVRPVLVYFVEPLILVSDNLGRTRFCADRFEAWISPTGHVLIIFGVLAFFQWWPFHGRNGKGSANGIESDAEKDAEEDTEPLSHSLVAQKSRRQDMLGGS